MLSYKDFMNIAKNSPAEKNRPRDYLHTHALRFYETYKLCGSMISCDSSILSVGAGRAFVELVLAQEFGVNVSVFDFEEAIIRNADQYIENNFKTIAGNFLNDTSSLGSEKFDLIMFCEIVEHIPMIPEKQFEKLVEHLKPNGYLIVSTPNIASLNSIIKLITGRNIITGAERLFSPVCAENESVHRREYVMEEICMAMHKVGLRATQKKYIFMRYPRLAFQSFFLFGILSFIKKWRPMMLIVGHLEK